MQGVLRGIHRKCHTQDAAHPLLPWLCAITRDKIIDAYRKRVLAVHQPVEDYTDVLPAEGVASPLSTRDARAEVDHLLAQLDPRSGKVLRALALRNKTQAEVSARLQISPANLRVTSQHALNRMAAMGRRDQP